MSEPQPHASGRSADQLFDSYARDFDAIYGGRRGPMGRLLDRLFRRSMLLRYSRSVEGCHPIAGNTVLDVGCGPGLYGIELARRGARHVVLLDPAPEMLALARERASAAGVTNRCTFEAGYLESYNPVDKFDFCIVMGVMDYVQDAQSFLQRVLAMTRGKAFFSFPEAKGLLAAVRRFRYKTRTPLYLYDQKDIVSLLDNIMPGKYSIEKLARDYFVEAYI